MRTWYGSPNERYRGRKIIVWAATMHAAHAVEKIDTLGKELSYEGVRTMGQVAHEALGDELFTIGFTAYAGEAGVPQGKPRRIEAAPAGSLDALAAAAGLEQAFIPLRALPEDSFLHEPLLSRPLGHSLMRARWHECLDAMIFQKTMMPSTRRK